MFSVVARRHFPSSLILILAGVAIASLTGSGLFDNARKAEGAHKNAQNLENETLTDYENWVQNYIDEVEKR